MGEIVTAHIEMQWHIGAHDDEKKESANEEDADEAR